MLITDAYRQLNTELHDSNQQYGTSSARWIDLVRFLTEKVSAASILDYGCGKGLLKQGLAQVAPGISVQEYDPAIPGKDALPSPAEFVVCTDVMEHIEPDCLDAVLEHLHSVTLTCAFVTVATRPALKVLADGRNAHLIVQDRDWWTGRFERYFQTTLLEEAPGEFMVLLAPKGNLT